MAFVTERITDMICLRLKDYGYAYDGHMYPKLYPVYLNVAHVIQIRLGLKKGFLKTGMKDQELFRQVCEVLDDILPEKRGDVNTKITYLYRDACNYKQPNEVIVNGHITEEQKQKIINCLDSREYFIPRQVEFPEIRFGNIDLETDTCWFELDKSSFEDTSEEPTLDMTPEEVVKQFEAAKCHWDDTDQSWMY